MSENVQVVRFGCFKSTYLQLIWEAKNQAPLARVIFNVLKTQIFGSMGMFEKCKYLENGLVY